MEKVKIKSVIDTGKTYKDSPIFNIELEDGRKGSCFDSRAKELKPGDETEFEIKEGNVDPQGNRNLYFNFPKDKKQFPKKDWSYQKRHDSLDLAIRSIAFFKDEATSDGVLKLAEKYFNYLNK